MRESGYLHISLLIEAIKSGEMEKLRALLDNGYSPNEMQHYTVKYPFPMKNLQATEEELLKN